MAENRQREIWFDGRKIPLERQDIWGLVNNSPLEKIVVSMEQRAAGRFPAKTSFVTEVRRAEDLERVESGEIVLAERRDLLAEAKRCGHRTCVSLSIDSGQALAESCQAAMDHDYAVVDFNLPTNIPLELIMARLQDRETVLLRRVGTVAEMEVAFGVLERGSDGVLFAGSDPVELQWLGNYLARVEHCQLDLEPLVVSEARHIGMGWRACVDTTGLMTKDEGMLVGSTSSGGIFVCSETHYLPYMNLRPFRVNAGAVHSYIWLPHGAAEYLTDLAAGSRVWCVNARGEGRELTVGRVKIEVRPLLMLRGEAAGRELNVIVQDDWHIRLMGADGRPRNATTIEPGDELLAHLCQPGRHVGIKVDESIVER